MKKSVVFNRLFLVFAALTSMLCSILICCNNPVPKTEAIQTGANDTIKKTDTTNTYLKDMDSFKKQITDSLEVNKKTLAEVKEKFNKDKTKVKADYKKTVDELEQKNKELQEKLDQYTAEGKQKWEVFKTDVSKDVDSLRKQIRNLTSKKS